jgi:mono/diheme cytochrome c family protein
MKAELAAITAAVTVATAAALPQPEPVIQSDAEHFKYGSIGAEANEGLPYWIWQAMPVICEDRLGAAGYSALGIVWEPERELPIGFSKRRQFGGDRVAINCALCHTATYRAAPDGQRQIVVGGPATRTSPQDYFRFLTGCAASDGFTADAVLDAASAIGTVSWTERLMYRFAFVGATRKALARRADEMAWADRQPDWGPGRVDPFNPLKFGLLEQPVDDSIGASDMVPLWNMAAHDGRGLHWDGINQSVHELMLSSGLANGATTKSIDLESLDRMEAWMRDVPPPAYPFAVDSALVSEGAAVFERECATCHAFGGSRTGTVIDVGEVGTDDRRVRSWTAAGAAAMNAVAEGTEADVDGFRKTTGYVAVPLDGIWLRAPYLHNGSIPTLEALLTLPAERPSSFIRGYDVYDPIGVGFVATGARASAEGFHFDTTLPGNGNQGHTYGTTLPNESKRSLIEFLKTQ